MGLPISFWQRKQQNSCQLFRPEILNRWVMSLLRALGQMRVGRGFTFRNFGTLVPKADKSTDFKKNNCFQFDLKVQKFKLRKSQSLKKGFDSD